MALKQTTMSLMYINYVDWYAGATLGKGLNRGMGTILGGGLGCISAVLAHNLGGVGNSIIIGTSVFIFGKS